MFWSVGPCCCAVWCVLSSGAAVCGVACFSLCLVLRGVVVFGWSSFATLSGAVWCWVLLCCLCCALPQRAVLFSAAFLGVALFFSVVPLAVSVWSVLVFGVGRPCCALVLVSAALCRFVLCSAKVCLVVLYGVVCFVVVLVSCPASSAAVAGSCALCLGLLLCSPAALHVVTVLSFLVPCFLAPLHSRRLLCGAVLAFCVVLSCPSGAGLCHVLLPVFFLVFAVGPCGPLLSPGVTCWRVLVFLSLSGRMACCPGVWCGVSWCLGPLCCVLRCCAIVWSCAVLLCGLYVELPVPVVSFLLLENH